LAGDSPANSPNVSAVADQRTLTGPQWARRHEMARRWLILGLVFAGTFAATYLLAVTGQLSATPGTPLDSAGTALKAAAMLTLIAGYASWGWRVIRAGSRSTGTSYAPTFPYFGASGGTYPQGGSSQTPIEQANGPSGRKHHRNTGR